MGLVSQSMMAVDDGGGCVSLRLTTLDVVDVAREFDGEVVSSVVVVSDWEMGTMLMADGDATSDRMD